MLFEMFAHIIKTQKIKIMHPQITVVLQVQETIGRGGQNDAIDCGIKENRALHGVE